MIPRHYFGTQYSRESQRLMNMAHPRGNWQAAASVVELPQHLLMIRRSHRVRGHRGQLAFFGGKREAYELDPAQTALRELEEESGLGASEVCLKGYLPPVFAGRRLLVIPVVLSSSWEESRLVSQLEFNLEVDAAFMVSKKSLADMARWRFGMRRGLQSENPLLFFSLFQADYRFLKGSPLVDPMIWGATARMIWNYLHLQEPES